VIAPLLVESQVFGALICARRKPESFSSGECEFLRQASEHTALAAHQAQLYTALQQAYDDLRQTQQQVMQQERLRALGQMASGIAHDINNAISPMALYTEALLEREASLSVRGALRAARPLEADGAGHPLQQPGRDQRLSLTSRSRSVRNSHAARPRRGGTARTWFSAT